MNRCESSSVKGSTGSFLVVSYDVEGYEREIETYLFNPNEVDKKKACELRNEYENLLTIDCSNRDVHENGNERSFEEWVNDKGIMCLKVTQYRVEPLEAGSTEYDAYCMESR